VAEHRINLRHCIQLKDTSILSAKSRYMGCIIRRQVRLRSTPTICESWKHLIQFLKEERSPSSYNCHNGIFWTIRHVHNAFLGHSSSYSFFATSTFPLSQFSTASCSWYHCPASCLNIHTTSLQTSTTSLGKLRTLSRAKQNHYFPWLLLYLSESSNRWWSCSHWLSHSSL
jgi:hypothetical protein